MVGKFTLSLKNYKNKEYGIGIPCICINRTEAEVQKWITHTWSIISQQGCQGSLMEKKKQKKYFQLKLAIK